MEKECEICGAWFEVTNQSQKYCPGCRESSGSKKRKMETNYARSYSKYGSGRKFVPHTKPCKYCGKEFYPTSIEYIFCSKECRDQYAVETAECRVCGKNLFALGVKANPHERYHYCSAECRQKYIEMTQEKCTCLECGKVFYRKNGGKYCSRDCFTKARAKGQTQKRTVSEKQKPPTVLQPCAACGKMFPVPLVSAGHMYLCCSPECYDRHHEMQKAKEEKQQEVKRKREEERYIRENGLCSICRTAYCDCERMSSNFRMSPKGAVFSGSLVVECPKYTAPKKKKKKQTA